MTGQQMVSFGEGSMVYAHSQQRVRIHCKADIALAFHEGKKKELPTLRRDDVQTTVDVIVGHCDRLQRNC